MNRKAIFVSIFIAAPAFADAIVFDPSNFAVNVEQVAHHIELIARMDAQIRNQLEALRNWEYTRIDDLLAGMDQLRGVFDENAAVFAAIDLEADFESRFPLAEKHYAEVDPNGGQALQRAWTSAERTALVEARAVQNRVYRQMAPTQERIGAYIEQSNQAPGPTAALQAGNEVTATLIAQLQAMQALEVADGRAELERLAIAQADAAYRRALRTRVMADWPQAGARP